MRTHKGSRAIHFYRVEIQTLQTGGGLTDGLVRVWVSAQICLAPAPAVFWQMHMKQANQVTLDNVVGECDEYVVEAVLNPR